jgi:hypothetical protein
MSNGERMEGQDEENEVTRIDSIFWKPYNPVQNSIVLIESVRATVNSYVIPRTP